MTRPKPEPLDPGEVRRKALAVVAADRFPHLATVDGDQPRLRPVSPVRTEGFTVSDALVAYKPPNGRVRRPA